MKLIELRQQRAALVQEARTLIDTAENEKRDMTGEEEQRYEAIMADVDKTGSKIAKEERMESLQSQLADGDDEGRDGDDPGEQSDNPGGLESRESKRYEEAFRRFLVGGDRALTAEEYRAMQVDDDTGGGYLVTPQQMVMQLLKGVDDVAIVRQFATIYQLRTAKSLGVPTLDSDADDADWTAELKTGSETELEFGQRELRPHPIAKRVKVSNTLLRQAAMSPDTLVRERLQYKFGITEEKAFMTGNGSQKPLGLFTASADGISTDRDEAGDNTATKIVPDTLITAKYKLKGQYHPRARWIMHRDVMAAVRKLKDGNGQYLWQPGIQGGAPDRILDMPYTLSEYAPNTMTTGLYVAMLGDYRYYWIAEALDMQLQRLSELYAETNQTGFIGRMEVDGMPVLEEAFVRVKMG